MVRRICVRWIHDDHGHHLDLADHSHSDFGVRLDQSVDVGVLSNGRRWTATFVTPEQARDLIDSWSQTGEVLPGTTSGSHGVRISELALSTMRTSLFR